MQEKTHHTQLNFLTFILVLLHCQQLLKHPHYLNNSYTQGHFALEHNMNNNSKKKTSEKKKWYTSTTQK